MLVMGVSVEESAAHRHDNSRRFGAASASGGLHLILCSLPADGSPWLLALSQKNLGKKLQIFFRCIIFKIRDTTSRGLSLLVCPSRNSERGGKGDCVKEREGEEGERES